MDWDFLCERVVDGGYVSWLFGSTPEGWNQWSLLKLQFRGDLLVMDSPRSLRAEFWPEYKANRKDSHDPVQETRKALVLEFRRGMLEDWLLSTVQVDGLEADDLVSVLALYGHHKRPFKVIGVDKDYLQLPEALAMGTLNGTQATLGRFRSHLQKAVQPWVREPLDILFVLALLGDAVDNIPRLIPPRRFDMFGEIMAGTTTGNRIDRAVEMFGDAFTRNVYLAVLPGPWVFDPVPTPEAVLDLLADGKYYEQKLQDVVKIKVLGSYYAGFPFHTVQLGSADAQKTV